MRHQSCVVCNTLCMYYTVLVRERDGNQMFRDQTLDEMGDGTTGRVTLIFTVTSSVHETKVIE